MHEMEGCVGVGVRGVFCLCSLLPLPMGLFFLPIAMGVGGWVLSDARSRKRSSGRRLSVSGERASGGSSRSSAWLQRPRGGDVRLVLWQLGSYGQHSSDDRLDSHERHGSDDQHGVAMTDMSATTDTAATDHTAATTDRCPPPLPTPPMMMMMVATFDGIASTARCHPSRC